MTESHSTTQSRPYTTVFFDLDGTLLPIDTSAFMRAYMASLSAFMTEHGIDAAEITQAVFYGVEAMAEHAPGILNSDAFWQRFCEVTGDTREEWEPLFTTYYRERFNEVGASVTPNPAAAQAVATLHAKGYKLALTTMPMFPTEAISVRLGWAGISHEYFDFVTSYDLSTAVKPQEAYYAEALQRAGAAGPQVLMVGNHTREDGGAIKLGCDIYFVTDHLIETEGGLKVGTCKHGSMADFAAFCEKLPAISA